MFTLRVLAVAAVLCTLVSGIPLPSNNAETASLQPIQTSTTILPPSVATLAKTQALTKRKGGGGLKGGPAPKAKPDPEKKEGLNADLSDVGVSDNPDDPANRTQEQINDDACAGC